MNKQFDAAWLLPALFDSDWYSSRVGITFRTDDSAFGHYLLEGWKQHKDPHVLFSVSYYLEADSELRGSGEEPLGHYLRRGWREQRAPHPLARIDYYLSQITTENLNGLDPLSHYLTLGWKSGLNISPFFDGSCYLDTYSDVRAAGVEPLTHYLKYGWKEGRLPFPISGVASAPVPSKKSAEPVLLEILRAHEARGEARPDAVRAEYCCEIRQAHNLQNREAPSPPAPVASNETSSREIDIRLTPINDLVFEGDGYHTTGADPQFAVGSSPGRQLSGWTFVKILFKTASAELTPTLYATDAEGSVTAYPLPPAHSGHEIQALIHLDEIASLRFDPTAAADVRFSIEHAQFIPEAEIDGNTFLQFGQAQRQNSRTTGRERAGRFRMNMGQHLEPRGDDVYCSTGEDPQFALDSADGAFPSGWTIFSVSTEIASPLIQPVLYVWSGEIVTPFPLLPMTGAASTTYLLRLPDRVTAMRFDPTDLVDVNFKITGLTFSEIFCHTDKIFLPIGDKSRQGEYASWVKSYDTLNADDCRKIEDHIDRFSNRPLLSVVMPVYNTRPKFLRLALDSIIAQLYPYWELCIADDKSPNPEIAQILKEYAAKDSRIRVVFRDKNEHISAATNTAVNIARGEFMVLMDHDDELPRHALYMVANELNEHPETDIIYTDEDKIDSEGNRHDPYFKPDWNLDLFYSQNFVAHLGVYRSSLVRQIGGFRVGFEGSQDYDFTLRAVNVTPRERIRHIPHVLYHWRIFSGVSSFSTNNPQNSINTARQGLVDYFAARQEDVDVLMIDAFPSWWRIKRRTPSPAPLVSLIVPTRDRIGLVADCVSGLLFGTSYDNIEIIIVNNDSVEPKSLEYFRAIQRNPKVRVLDVPGPFNFSLLNNEAVKVARGEFVCFVNNDIVVIEPDWLSEMVSQVVRPGVGAVGAKLLYANGNIQHAGVVLGIYGGAAHGHRHFPANSIGYFGRPQLQQETSAVTAALLLMPKHVFEAIGGYDDVNLVVGYNDVDLCLRIREANFQVVYTPFAELYHLESASRGQDLSPEQKARNDKERAYMRSRWGHLLDKDPYYSVNLSLSNENYTLAFPPRARKPWREELQDFGAFVNERQQACERQFPNTASDVARVALNTCLVIANRNAHRGFVSLARSLTRGSFCPARIVVVDNSHGQGEASLRKAVTDIKNAFPLTNISTVIDDSQDFDADRGLNLGMYALQGEKHVVVIGEECAFGDQWFEYLVKAFCAQRERAVVMPISIAMRGSLVYLGLAETASGTTPDLANYEFLTTSELVQRPVLSERWCSSRLFMANVADVIDADGSLFDRNFLSLGAIVDLATRLRRRAVPSFVTTASAVILLEDPRIPDHLAWRRRHDARYLTAKAMGRQPPQRVDFVCPFHRGDVLIGIQVAAQAKRMGIDVRMHVAESLQAWVADFRPDYPVELIPIAVPSATETALSFMKSCDYVTSRSDAGTCLAFSHPMRGLDETGYSISEFMLETFGLLRSTKLQNLEPVPTPLQLSAANELTHDFGDNTVLLHLSGGWDLKTIPDHIASRLIALVKAHGCRIVQIGGPGDKQNPKCDGWITANLSTGHWATIFRKSRALIGVDSWSAHFAAIMDIPQATLYGSTHPMHVNSKKQFVSQMSKSVCIGPAVDCSPCNSLTCLRSDVSYCSGFTIDEAAIASVVN